MRFDYGSYSVDFALSLKNVFVIAGKIRATIMMTKKRMLKTLETNIRADFGIIVWTHLGYANKLAC